MHQDKAKEQGIFSSNFWLETVYYSIYIVFSSKFKNSLKIQFDCNQLKLGIKHKSIYTC